MRSDVGDIPCESANNEGDNLKPVISAEVEEAGVLVLERLSGEASSGYLASRIFEAMLDVWLSSGSPVYPSRRE